MATLVSLAKQNNSSTANFRQWGKAISDALTALGFPKTSDTGQIDWATVSGPQYGAHFVGYEIRRLSDPLQATAPFFIKIEFGAGSSGNTLVGMKVSIGTSTNGAGTLTGVITAAYETNMLDTPKNGSPDANGDYNILFAGNGSWFSMYMGENAGNNYMQSLLLCWERTRDVNGAETADGLQLYYSVNGNSVYQLVVRQSGYAVQHAGSPFLVPSVGTGLKGTDIVVYPPYVFMPEMSNAGLAAVMSFTTNIGAGTITPVNFYGTTHTYRFVTNVGAYASAQGTSTRPGIRWE